jgi:hypothetical protein
LTACFLNLDFILFCEDLDGKILEEKGSFLGFDAYVRKYYMVWVVTNIMYVHMRGYG